MSQPSVSVIIAARNAAGTIGEQLAALASQDYGGEWEVIVVDDGSTDATASVARSFADRIPRLRVVPSRAGVGRGASAPRNTGVRASAGDVILCCDADDVVAPGWIGAMVDALADADLVGGALRPIGIPATSPRRGSLPTLLGHLPYAVTCNVGFHRSVFDALDGFDESLETTEDVDFSWRAQYLGYHLAHAPAAEVRYRLRATARAAFLQGYRNGRGAERLRRRHERTGTLPAEGRRAMVRRVLGEVRALGRVDQLLRRRTRRRYAKAAGWLAGSLRDFAKR